MTAYRTCSKCTSSCVRPLTYTWWGGWLGPKLLSHVKCHDCGHQFNGKTGKPNTRSIVAYTIIVGSIAIALGYLAFSNIDYSTPSDSKSNWFGNSANRSVTG